jgi:hypothetical protein
MKRPTPRRALVGLVLAACLASGVAVATESSEFGDANRAYADGRYPEAIALYEDLVSHGVVHEDLFYDLGNAYFRAGQLGPAIYSYERALRVAPDFDDARFNLEVARAEVAARVADRLTGAETDPLWMRVVSYFSLSQLAVAFLCLDALLFAALVALRFLSVGFARTALAASVVFLSLATAGSLGLLTGQIYLVERVEQGVVLADQVVMREGPDHSLAERGQLHPGLRVRIIDQQEGWLRIRLANGVDGWVPVETVGRL